MSIVLMSDVEEGFGLQCGELEADGVNVNCPDVGEGLGVDG